MPLNRLATDAFGVVTICLVSLLVLLGLLCIFYSFYFQSQIRRRGYIQLAYFNGPWIIRIALVSVAVWWGLWEIARLSLLRRNGAVLHSLSSKWQENICKLYIISNLGFAEPTMLLILMFLLQASLQRRECGTLNKKWNRKACIHVSLFCFPIFMLQLGLVLFGPKLNNKHELFRRMPKYFTRSCISSLCTYPLLSTTMSGLFSSLLIVYMLYLGARILSLVINKGLRRRVCILIISVIIFLALRILFLGFSVLSYPEHLTFELVVFVSFLAMVCFITVGICVIVYCPIADSLAMDNHRCLEMGGQLLDARNNSSPAASPNQSLVEVDPAVSPGRSSDASTKGGSISFRVMVREDALSEGGEEVNLLPAGAHSFLHLPESPPLPGRPMIPLRELSIH